MRKRKRNGANFTIEQNVPMPEPGRPHRYPFKKMKIGDSFFVEGERTGGRVYSAARQYGQRHHLSFICRRENNGVRIWRIK